MYYKISLKYLLFDSYFCFWFLAFRVLSLYLRCFFWQFLRKTPFLKSLVLSMITLVFQKALLYQFLWTASIRVLFNTQICFSLCFSIFCKKTQMIYNTSLNKLRKLVFPHNIQCVEHVFECRNVMSSSKKRINNFCLTD